MNKGTAIVGGVGLGAALMYFLDPDRGKKRRALVRDKAETAARKVSDAAIKTNRDLRNRAYGIVAETRGLFKHEQVSDEVLIDRVRAKLGRVCSTPGAIQVSAENGVVRLEGSVPISEMDRVLRVVRLVRGVKDIDAFLTRIPQGQVDLAAAGA